MGETWIIQPIEAGIKQCVTTKPLHDITIIQKNIHEHLIVSAFADYPKQMFVNDDTFLEGYANGDLNPVADFEAVVGGLVCCFQINFFVHNVILQTASSSALGSVWVCCMSSNE